MKFSLSIGYSGNLPIGGLPAWDLLRNVSTEAGWQVDIGVPKMASFWVRY